LKASQGAYAPRRRRDRDRGQTFVEILVSIVLLGTVVSGTLTALRATIVSSRVDANQAKANAWLFAAEDALYRATYYSCADPGPGVDGLRGLDEGDILF
jgi:type II secretory pathway pseudopilin PulG